MTHDEAQHITRAANATVPTVVDLEVLYRVAAATGIKDPDFCARQVVDDVYRATGDKHIGFRQHRIEELLNRVGKELGTRKRRIAFTTQHPCGIVLCERG